ncbi:KTSC domain-containing protein [Pseudomonas plecoglossicida]|uniref:KTSC domain-containing protein n=1 Tax=Pseudomonas plecoglossicida TaxID=70775 RepID=UPI003D194BEA
MKKTLLGLLFFGATASTVTLAETVFVKYQGPVDLKPFTCTATASSLVHRICYQSEQSYLVVLLDQTYYHYCRMPAQVVTQWLNADSKGRFYLGNIKGNFDCRLGGIPNS